MVRNVDSRILSNPSKGSFSQAVVLDRVYPEIHTHRPRAWNPCGPEAGSAYIVKASILNLCRPIGAVRYAVSFNFVRWLIKADLLVH